MYTQTIKTAAQRERSGLTSIWLMNNADVPETNLAVTWVEVEPGARQILHNHAAEQVYVIINGRGVMTVADEQVNVERGEVVYVPSNAMHGIENTGDDTLIYLSAATPAMDFVGAYDRGQLTPEKYEA